MPSLEDGNSAFATLDVPVSRPQHLFCRPCSFKHLNTGVASHRKSNVSTRSNLRHAVSVAQEEYNDQLEDIREEIENKYGKLTACVLPRPSPRGPDHDHPGVGLAFVSFEVRHNG